MHALRPQCNIAIGWKPLEVTKAKGHQSQFASLVLVSTNHTPLFPILGLWFCSLCWLFPVIPPTFMMILVWRLILISDWYWRPFYLILQITWRFTCQDLVFSTLFWPQAFATVSSWISYYSSSCYLRDTLVKYIIAIIIQLFRTLRVYLGIRD